MGIGKWAFGRKLSLLAIASVALCALGVAASGAVGHSPVHHRARATWHRYSLSSVKYLTKKELRPLLRGDRLLKPAPKPKYVPVPKGTVNHTGVAHAMIAESGSCSLPSAPGSPSASGGTNQASITWTAANGNGNAITAYVVTAYKGGTAPENAVGTPASATSTTLTGLAGASYTFEIFAQNACGNGPAATTSSTTVTGGSTYASQVIADGADAYFRLGEASNTVTAADSSGHGLLAAYNTNNNSNLGAPGALASDPATSINSNGGWVAYDSGPVALPTANAPRTLQAWVKPSDGYCRWVLGYGVPSSTNGSFNIAECGSQDNGQTYGGTGSFGNGIAVSADNDDLYFRAAESLNDGAWHLITVTYNGTSVTAYLDGTSLGSKDFSSALSTGEGDLALGSYTGQCCYGNWAYGGLQDEAVYPTALSATQISSLFSASGYAKPTAPASPTASSSNNNSATVNWTASSAPGTSVTGYIVTAKKGTTAEQSIATTGSATSVTITGLPAASYTFTVTAVDPYGSTASAATSSVTVAGSTSTYASTVLGDKPAVFYRLDEASGSKLAADSSGKGLTAFYSPCGLTQGVGGPLPSDPATAVMDPSCNTLWNSLANEYARANLPSGTATRTLQAWVKPNTTGCQYFAGYGTNATDELFAAGECANAVMVSLYSDDHSFYSSRNIDDGNWHLITVEMVYSTTTGNSITAYLDGQKLGSQSTNPPDTLAGTGLTIGEQPASCCYNGSLADVAVYPSALSATAITALMTASGNGVPSAPTGVTATGGTNKATVTWTASTVPSGSVSFYVVTEYASGKAQQALAVPGNQTSATIDSLAAGSSYTFKVVAYDTYGASAASAASSTTTVTGASSTYASTILSSKPVLYYRLGETGNVPAAADSSGAGILGYYDSSGVTQGVSGAIDDGSDLAASQTGPFLVEAPGSTTIPSGDNDRTVEAWIKPADSYCGPRDIVSMGTNNTDQAFDLAECPNAVVVSAYGDDHYFYTSHPLNDGAWHFLVATYTDANGVDELTAYLDGVSLGTQSFNNTLVTPAGSTLWIGSGANDCCVSFYGSIDEVAVFGSALSASTVAAQFKASGHAAPGAPTGVSATGGTNQATVSWTAPSSSDTISDYVVTSYSGSTPGLSESVPGTTTSATITGLKAGTPYTFKVVAYDAYGAGTASAASNSVTPTGSATTFASTLLGDGPVAYYRLAEPTGSEYAADSSGNGQIALYNQSTTTFGNASALPTDTGTTISDNGNDYAAVDEDDVQTQNLPAANSPRTLLAWVKLGDANCRYAMGYGDENNEEAFGLAVCPNQIGVVGWNDDHYFATSESLNDGNWHQVAITFDGTNINAYVDGNSLGTQQFKNTIDTPVGTSLYVGAGPQDAGYAWYGGLAHVAVFGSALSASQIQALFNASGYAVPTAPTSVSVTSSSANQATVSWSGATTGTGSINGYVLTAYLGGTTPENSVATNGTTSSATLKGLGGGSYTFKVQAINNWGAGPAGSTSSSTTISGSATYASTVLADGAVAYYRLGEPNGTYAASSAGGAPGYYNQSSGCVTLGQSGALTHDSSTSILDSDCWAVLAGDPSDKLPSGSSPRSVAFWFKPSNTQCWNYTMGYGTTQTADDQSFALWLCPTQAYFWGYGDDTQFSSLGGANLDDGNWHQIVLTYDGTTNITLYVDGNAVGTQSISTPLSTPEGTQLWIGSSDSSEQSNTGTTTGNLQDFAVFPTALTQAQVTALYGAR